MVVVAGENHSLITTRLKREQCNRTKHDSNFSPWKILIGPSDWEDYSNGKEGSARYRIHNLPEKSCPGVYELGIAVSRSGLGRNIYKLSSDRIIVVYLGETDDVRKRLQCYGTSGSHLKDNCSDDVISASLQKKRPLFQEIFQQGYPIIYRWAPMKNKEDAKKIEVQLLGTFDYAWNTTKNGNRRCDDILQKLKKIASGTRTLTDMAKELLPIPQKRVGIRIKSSKLPLTDNKSEEEDSGSYGFLSRVFNFNRSRPRIVHEITSPIQENAKICGVALSDGSVCTMPPAEGRKRCPEHKGMRTKVSASKAISEPMLESNVVLESDVCCKTEGNDYMDQNVHHNVEDSLKVALDSPVSEAISSTNICGVALSDGSVCRIPPAEGRKRCPEHKGMRTKVSTSKAIRERILETNVVLESDVCCKTKGNDYMDQTVGHNIEDSLNVALDSPVSEASSSTNICGIILHDGSPCRRQPVKGRKRCQEHKGKRISSPSHVNQWQYPNSV